jgi:hypothetical protein
MLKQDGQDGEAQTSVRATNEEGFDPIVIGIRSLGFAKSSVATKSSRRPGYAAGSPSYAPDSSGRGSLPQRTCCRRGAGPERRLNGYVSTAGIVTCGGVFFQTRLCVSSIRINTGISGGRTSDSQAGQFGLGAQTTSLL